MKETAQRYCTFSVGELLVGLEIERVREVVSDRELTPVPLAAASVAGILNLRGEIITGIDARSRLGMPAREGCADRSVHVIVTTEGEAVSLIVDAERDVVELQLGAAQSVPDTVGADVGRLLNAIYELDAGELLLVLDPDLAVSVSEL